MKYQLIVSDVCILANYIINCSVKAFRARVTAFQFIIGKKSNVRYDEIICRDERNPREIWRRSKQRLEQGGRCYVARRKVEE
ncbi:hypothetical protein, partial [Chamaesiphon sp. VAR_48_metabat_403]|uniref:hypothetical protein n=1 Tax=Chamaesiphon sp. VAR_48_metabat_403 TaxID=2964700 RepID=UPI00286D766A